MSLPLDDKIMNLIAYLLIFFSLFNIVYKANDIIILLLSIELLLIGISIKFIYLSFIFDNFYSFLFGVLILILGAAESAIGLSIYILTFTKK